VRERPFNIRLRPPYIIFPVFLECKHFSSSSASGYPFDEDDKVSLRHTIIAIAMGALFSLTPPLLQAADDIKRLVRKYRKSCPPSKAEAGERSLETILEEVRASEARKQTEGSPSDARDEPKR
jgi:hypothetical protein